MDEDIVLSLNSESGSRDQQAGNLAVATAHWLRRDIIAWQHAGDPSHTYRLHYAPEGGISLAYDGVVGGEVLTLDYNPSGLPPELQEAFPHLATFAALRVPADDAAIDTMLRGQVVISGTGAGGNLFDATSLQLAGVLDDLYADDGQLGVCWEGGLPTLRVWAPTAQSVKLHLFADARAETRAAVFPMQRGERGVWSVKGEANWDGQFYLYEVAVYVRQTGQVEHNLVTDPYSLSLATNSSRSQIIELDDPKHQPDGWTTLAKPRLEAFTDSVIYELHVRDFSISDHTVRPAYRGTYMAFTERESNGMRHLRALSEAGMTHIHLLPVFDIATVEEDRAKRREVDAALLATFPPDSDQQTEAVRALRNADGFNWGYDPYHYTVPEGSYSTDPNGAVRVREFRTMVKALNESGLRVVMDVVYNHTNASGQSHRSVLDKVVPGYYHRLNAHGEVENSTCCHNTASEHYMMEKLVIDSVLTWAREHKVDGFRFDLMGHHMKANMTRLRERLDRLTLEHDGVDGTKIYLYGEGWDFGEVANNARGVNATQFNMAGTGIGSFNDRLRDAVRGGRPFDSGEHMIRAQGFVTGLFTDPNELNQGSDDERLTLLQYQDWLRVGMAGNLRDCTFEDRYGRIVSGGQVDYHGQATGYTLHPQEHVIYAEAHDNQTLFDTIQYKVRRDTPMSERVRLQNLGNALVVFSQGVPFVHAGQDMLRSKSLDRNSYNSGDWFNRLDWSYETNNWGVGLPPIEHAVDVPIQKALLANPALKPTNVDIVFAAEQFREYLRIRTSSRLLRLRSVEEIEQRLRFHNTGPDQLPGLIVMSVSDNDEQPLDGGYTLVVVAINAAPGPQSLQIEECRGMALELHPILQASVDARVREAMFEANSVTLQVPGRTAVVFVVRRQP